MKRRSVPPSDICKRLIEMIAAIHGRRGARAAERQQRRLPLAPSPELLALCAATISAEEYLQLKLEAAIQPLEPLLRPEALAAVRATMHERLRTEPAWVKVAEQLREAVLRERTRALSNEAPIPNRTPASD